MPTSSRSSRSSLGASAGASPMQMPSPPTARPPSTYHDWKGDVKVQDIFVDAVEAHRRRGQTHRVLYPGSDRFELERMDVWNYDSICTPCLILQPKKTAEVSSCVKAYTTGVRKCLSEIRRTDAKLGIPRLCVAGGRNSHAAMMEGAIVLDLSRMNGVAVDVPNRTATVQGGARILDLDNELGKHGLMAVSATFQNLGVVGTILAGGIGYASRKHGLSADNVLSAEVILADGRLKRCSPNKNEDLFWSLCGGGGGIGVVTQVTLRCYPLCNAALLTYDLLAQSAKVRRNAVQRWGRWICGSSEGSSNMSMSDSTTIDTGAPREIYSQIILRTESKYISFVGTSVDPEVIPQSEDRLEQFHDVTRMNNRRRGPSALFGRSNMVHLPTSWERVPGLADLKKNKFGCRSRFNSKFRMVRYYDELQCLSDSYMKPGNVFISFKYARALTDQVAEVLVNATTGGRCPNNESRISIASAGCEINEMPKEIGAFDARNMNFMIYVEGRWSDSNSESRDSREKEKVESWVQLVGSQLQMCEGVQSTAHPESTRDYVSRSGRSEPPLGWYNFGKENGTRLEAIKKRRDPRNVFSLASRVSYKKSKDAVIGTISPVSSHGSNNDGIVLKQGEVKASKCVEADRQNSPRRSVRDRHDKDESSDDNESIEATDDKFDVVRSSSNDGSESSAINPANSPSNDEPPEDWDPFTASDDEKEEDYRNNGEHMGIGRQSSERSNASRISKPPVDWDPFNNDVGNENQEGYEYTSEHVAIGRQGSGRSNGSTVEKTTDQDSDTHDLMSV